MGGALLLGFLLITTALYSLDRDAKKEKIILEKHNQKLIEFCSKEPLVLYQEEEQRLVDEINRIEERYGLVKSNPGCSKE